MALTRRMLLGAPGLLALCSVPGILPALGDDGPTEFKAAASEGNLFGEDGPSTRIWAYNGTAPGPVLRVKQGERVNVRLRNELEEGTTIHWHGIRLDNAMDGVPDLTQSVVAPGETFDYTFVAHDAGTYWYHSHNRSWEQVARGLHGILIVEEAEPVEVDRDLLLVLDDWRLTEDGQIEAESFGHMMDLSHGGRLGNVLTINGKNEVAEVTVRAGERIRLRLCNVANARIFDIRFADLAINVVALDGQPVEPFEPRQAITLAPAQRTDIIFDVESDPSSEHPIYAEMGNDLLTIGRVVVESTAPVRDNLLETSMRLPPNPLPLDLDGTSAKQIELLMQGGAMGGMTGAMMGGRHMGMSALVSSGMVWAFNGVAGRTDTPLFSVPRGQPVVLSIVNDTAWPHAMHWHGHHALILEGGGLERTDVWRDTALSLPEETMRVAFSCENPGKWLLHCHMLEHQLAGMSTWFEVTA